MQIMSNIVLYRKYRPTNFAEVVGQEHIVRTLQNAVAAGAVAHAYLFAGPRGSGKTTMARLLAKAANCESPKEGESCNKCDSCSEIMQGRAMDLVEIDAASNRGIDEIRELKEGARFAPTRLKYKVFVVDEAHQLSKDAANALLKLLEEPPAHAIFILATTEVHKMIGTIASRCQKFNFKKFTVAETVEQLEKIVKAEKGKVSKDALVLVAQEAEGSLRDAVGLLEKVLTFSPKGGKTSLTVEQAREVLGVADNTVLSEFADVLLQKDAGKCIEVLNQRLQAGMDPHEFSKGMIRYLRYLLLASVDPSLIETLSQELTEENRNKLKEQAGQVSEEWLSKTVGYFLRAESEMRHTPIVQLPLELAIVDSCIN